MAEFTDKGAIVCNFGHTLESPGCFENPEAQATSQANYISISGGGVPGTTWVKQISQVPPIYNQGCATVDYRKLDYLIT